MHLQQNRRCRSVAKQDYVNGYRDSGRRFKLPNVAWCVFTALAIVAASGCTQVEHATQQARNAVDNVYDIGQRTGHQGGSGNSGNSPRPIPTVAAEGASFSPGNQVIFQSRFSNTSRAEFLKRWKTNGSGELVTVSGYSGKWLALAENSSYKLRKFIRYPQRFTIQFDLLTIGGTADEVKRVDFGFQRNNVVRQYIRAHTATGLELAYFVNAIYQYSHARRRSHSDFDFVDLLNRAYPVAIAVNGQRMFVYVNGQRVAASEFFRPHEQKHFFISGSDNYRGQAKAFIRNFRVATFASDVTAKAN